MGLVHPWTSMWPARHLARSDIGVCWMNEWRDTRKPVMAHVTFRWVVGRLFYFDASLLPAPPGCPLRGWMQGVGVFEPPTAFPERRLTEFCGEGAWG